jgi:hypothetical protein
MNAAVQRVIDALQAGGFAPRRNGAGWTARCPGHDDRDPSLSVGEGQYGKAVVHCHAGCAVERILESLSLRAGDLFEERRADRVRETRYPIRDAAGQLVATHIRRDGPDGKRFHWERDGKPSLGGMRVASLPLYGSELVPAMPADEPVMVTEGEKACDVLRSRGFQAVATVTGAAACPDRGVFEVLAGRDVVLWPDSDEPGASHMRKVAARLDSVARSVRVFKWAGAPKGGDAADYFASGATSNGLRAELATAPPAEASPIDSAALGEGVPAETNLRFLTAADITAIAATEVPWIAPPWVASGCITLLDGKVKAAGKTTFTAALVRAVLDGDEFLGQLTKRTPVVWLTEQSPTSFGQVLRRAGLEQRHDLLVLSWHDTRSSTWPEIAEAAVHQAREFGAGLLVVDTLSQFAGLLGDAENAAGDALRAIQPLQAASAQGLAVLICRHERKSGGDVGDSGRGSSATAGAVDIVLALRRPQGATRSTIRSLHGLSRLDGTPDEVMIELVDGCYVSLGTTNDVAAQEARQAVLDTCLESPAEALPVKAVIERNPGLKRTTVQEAIEALLASGEILRLGSGKKNDAYRYHLQNGFCRNSFSTNGRELSDHTPAAGLVSAETPAGSGRRNPEPETSGLLRDAVQIERFLQGNQP